LNAATRVFLAFYSLLLIALAVGLGVLAWYRRNQRQLDIEVGDFNFIAAIASADAERWIFTGILAAIGLVALFTLWLALAPRQRKRGGVLRLRQEGGGTVEVSADAIENLLRDELERLPDVRSAEPRVRVSGDSVEPDLTLVAEPSANISALTNEAARTTIDTLREQVGVANVRRPTVRINYEDSNARPRPGRGYKPQAAPPNSGPAERREVEHDVEHREPPPEYPPRADEEEHRRDHD
jgi:hypothetical protein